VNPNCVTCVSCQGIPISPDTFLMYHFDARTWYSLTCMNEVNLALEQNDFETAFSLLQRALQHTRDPREQGALALELAAVYALFGVGGMEGLAENLERAILFAPDLKSDALYAALQANRVAFAFEELPDVDDSRRLKAIEAAKRASSGAATARFYAGSALIALGELELGLSILESALLLPTYLQWRAWSWRGGALEELGRWRDASLAYHHAAQGASGSDKAALLQDKAAMLLDLEEPHEALIALNESQTAVFGLEAPLDAAARLHLEARAHLMLENPRLAKERSELAAKLELSVGEPSFPITLVMAQSLAALEDWTFAIPAFERAVKLADEPDKGFALHELGLAQMDAGLPDESRHSLSRALLEPTYPHKAELHADLAELEYRLGEFDAAERQARIALDLGAVVPASLLLANIAYEYYRLDDALEHYARALETATEASRDWVIANQMTADTLVQLGWRSPERILHHASLALPHLDAADEWAITLDGYIERARQLIAPSGTISRTLN
jgi:Tfp pilus assembly protein PilF